MADDNMREQTTASRQLTLVLGGARSGKTRRALELASAFARKVYIATAEPHDEEMRARIARHAAERDSTWMTIEAPLALAEALGPAGGEIAGQRTECQDAEVLVVDCLTLWLSNLMHADRNVEAETERLVAALTACPAHVVLVSNEVGLGIVPDNELARAFRDAQGRLNQEIARAAHIVEFVAAALPLRLKG